MGMSDGSASIPTTEISPCTRPSLWPADSLTRPLLEAQRSFASLKEGNTHVRWIWTGSFCRMTSAWFREVSSSNLSSYDAQHDC